VSAGILTMAVAGALVAWQAGLPAQNQPAATQPKVSRYTKWLEEDVVYIIEDRERAAFQSLRTDAGRDHFIEQFWQRRNPTPGTPENEFKKEHYRRIAYANGHFAWRSVPGWKTDRGRIYIVFGPPDEIEFHPSGRPAGGGEPATNYPVEQWLYRHIKDIGDNVLIDYDDAAKTGDFKMTKDPNPNGGKLIRHP
jgi:GWxTD domain-containing protein